jgi:repressor LexA
MDRRFLPSPEVFFLRVKGESMIGRGILDGDYVLIQPGDAKDGDIIAARLGEEATIKTLRRRDGKTVLEPANPAEKEIVVTKGSDFSILGIACGVFRPFTEMPPNEGGNGAGPV